MFVALAKLIAFAVAPVAIEVTVVKASRFTTVTLAALDVPKVIAPAEVKPAKL